MICGGDWTPCDESLSDAASAVILLAKWLRWAGMGVKNTIFQKKGYKN